MSENIFKDIKEMHEKFGHSEWANKNAGNAKLMKKLLAFRILKMMDEEMNELRSAAFVDESPEDIVDAIIDLIVFGATILDLMGVDGEKAWNEVYKANMNKTSGVKPGRSNKFGMPDLIKNEGWQEPSHKDNVGILGSLFEGE